MDWLKEWVLQLAGVIVLGTICDMIMIEGEMKKYVKPIVGFALIFTMIRPVTALSEGKMRMDILQKGVGSSTVIIEKANEKQKMHILDIYEKNLAKEIEKVVYENYKCRINAEVYADYATDKIGDIEKIEIKVWVREGKVVNTEGIKRYIAEEFGVDNGKVDVTLNNRGEG